MSEVTRYSFEQYPHESYMIEDVEGRYVEYKDYAALQEKFDFKQNLTEQIVALQKQCDALAAENAALVHYLSACAGAVENWNSWADAEDRLAPAPETPATDAYLNSVRAEGAIAVRDALVLADDGSDIYATATNVAVKLRAGEPS